MLHMSKNIYLRHIVFFIFKFVFFCGYLGTDSPKDKKNSYSKKDSMNPKDVLGVTSSAQIFTLKELAAATKNFRPECFIGEGGFGRVYKGRLQSTGQVNY